MDEKDNDQDLLYYQKYGTVNMQTVSPEKKPDFWEQLKKSPVIIIIFLANVIAYIICVKRESQGFETGGINYEYITINKEYVRFISYMFLHVDFSHIFNNMFALILFGTAIEPKLGSFRTAVIYGFSGLIGGLCSMYIYHIFSPDRMHFCIGASGAVYGLMCCYYIIRLRKNEKTNTADLVKSILLIVIYSIFSIRGNVDVWCHLGGGIAGGIATFILTVRSWENLLESKVLKIAGIILILLMCLIGIRGANIGQKASDLPDERVDYIKEERIIADKDVSFEQGFSRIFTDGEWQAFTSTENLEVVQFDGIILKDGVKKKFTIQFVLSQDLSSYEISYAAIDDEPITYDELDNLFEKMTR